MDFRFAPLLSGSSGNSLYVGAGDTHILVDAGVSAARLLPQMQAAGVDPRALSAILVTHEHSDHIAGVGVLSRKFDLPIYATEGTWRVMGQKIGVVAQNNRRVILPGQDFYLGRINVMPFAIPHDAVQPVGYSFMMGRVKCAVATDIGCLQSGWMDEVAGSDVLLLEANHDVDMLKAGRYPYHLKQRILSRHGHLSNDDCAKAVVQLRERGVRHIILGHLSGENNLPELALLTVQNAIAASGYEPDEELVLSVARRDMLCGVFSMGMGGMAGE